jgi:polyphosphate kinase 2 (PPK2 family)
MTDSHDDPTANKASDALLLETPAGQEHYNSRGQLKKAFYEGHLEALQEELVKLQYWVQQHGLRVLVIF